MALGTNLGILAQSGAGGGVDTESMIFTITTTGTNEDFIIRGLAGANNYDVDWGDSSSDSGVTSTDKTHTYSVAGTYEIKITGDIYLRQTNTTNAAQYTEFKQWGTNTTIRGIREFFANCINMTYTATDAPNFNFTVASSYQGPYRMFYKCNSITTLDLSNWDTSAFNGGTTAQAFYSMDNITSVNLTGWDVSNITSAASWFQISGNGGAGLTITAPNLNWSAATTIASFFQNCNMVSANITGWTLRAAGTNISQAFRDLGNLGGQTGGLDLDLTGWTNTGAMNTANGSYLFLTSKALSTVDLTNWDFSNVTNFTAMFSGCHYLTDIVGLNTLRFDSATIMDSAFVYTYRLIFDTHNFHNDFGANWSVADFGNCFYKNGYSLSAGSRGVIPNIINWDMSNATDVYQFFRESVYEDSNQTFTPSTSWDLSGLAGTDLKLFAYNMTGIETWDWSNVTIPSAVTDLTQFLTIATGATAASPKTLTTVIFGANCDFSGVTAWSNFLQNQTSLTTLTFDSSVSFAATTTMSNMLTLAPLTVASYDNFLIRAAATNTNTVTLTATGAQYSCAVSAGATARATLVTAGWTISDNGCT
jgi:surface protein